MFEAEGHRKKRLKRTMEGRVEEEGNFGWC